MKKKISGNASLKKPTGLIIGKYSEKEANCVDTMMRGYSFKLQFHIDKCRMPKWKIFDFIFFTREGFNAFPELFCQLKDIKPTFIISQDRHMPGYPDVLPITDGTEMHLIDSLMGYYNSQKF